jgi:hypothetical protein
MAELRIGTHPACSVDVDNARMRRLDQPRTAVPPQRVQHWPEHDGQRPRAGVAEAVILLRLRPAPARALENCDPLEAPDGAQADGGGR